MLDTREASAGAVLTVDLDAIRANYRLLRDRLGGTACAGVVKADAYGLGASRVAPALAAEGCRHFFVAHLDEAIALRPHLPDDADLFVLHGVMPGVEADCIAHRIIPVLNSLPQIDAWTGLSRSLGRRLPAILQVDTGMSRLGLSAREMDLLAGDPARLDGIEMRFVMSHLACAEQQSHGMNAEQLARFREARARLPAAPGCFANSSGIFLGPDYHFDLARPGAALYGVAPIAGAPNPMRGVVRLQGRVIQVRDIEAGARVGYGGSWTAPGPARIATVSVGYADGYLRSLGNRGAAWRGGVRLPVVGVVSMDTVTLDVSALGGLPPDPGSMVDLIGEHNPVDAVAEAAGTIGYEILTSLGGRYFRHYLGG
ncbi:alanine racemase [Skermanella mucosa]|uniref:alanine racemase n=1 Tax=Skermanella mucosa TaxID=1789672 RepID=UPI00192B9319|nr:alanine racemase [Skermanella mucosa]UEM18529.1 alanine racemase [Skermanella mucosa]